MSRINAKTMEFAVEAYHQLRETPEGDHRAAWYSYEHDTPQWLKYTMFRRHPYYGEWALFDGGSYVTTFDGDYLKSLYDVSPAFEWHRAKQCQREGGSE